MAAPTTGAMIAAIASEWAAVSTTKLSWDDTNGRLAVVGTNGTTFTTTNSHNDAAGIALKCVATGDDNYATYLMQQSTSAYQDKIQYPLAIVHNTDGTPAAGFGVGIYMFGQDSNKTTLTYGLFRYASFSVTPGAVSAKLEFYAKQAGTNILKTTIGGATWSTSGWARGIELEQGNILKWKKGTNYTYGIGQSGDVLYFGFNAAEDASAAMAYGFYLAPSSSTLNTANVVGNVDATVDVIARNNLWSHDGGVHSISDERLKENIKDYTAGLSIIKQLRPIAFNFKANNPLDLKSDETIYGLSAQEFQKILPEAVGLGPQPRWKPDMPIPGKTSYLEINLGIIKYLVINAIKELDIRISKLEEPK
jgi:hypothetical protein